jgi:hypothetical protein
VPSSCLAINHMTDEAHREAPEGLFGMIQEQHWNMPLISVGASASRGSFDGFTPVERGLVRPAQ